MTQRRHASMAVLAALAAVWLLPAPTAAQDYGVPRTPWGEPDLQGVWDFRTVTPMERPDEFEGQEFLTEEEAAALEQQAVENQVDRPPRAGDPGTYNQFWMDFGPNIIGTRRTSLIVDPPDGKIPELAAPAKRRQEELAAAREGVGDDVPRPGHWVEDVPVSVRCIVGFNSGPPMYPAAYNNNVQIFQAPGYVALYNEMGPASRIVPLDGRDHLPQHLRQWLGDSRGRWEGDTLVVETKNFLRETAFGRYAGAVVRLGGSGPNIHLIERFTRVADGTLLYEATVEDDTTWVRPWTYAVPMRLSDQPVYEYACHEGNYGLENILAGALLEAEEAGR
ncbi:MAG: hypothetical protein F4Y57_07580 [Acidobacteria bacterium]|nr:hypothetical protein [Acidobacteriota bacterium]